MVTGDDLDSPPQTRTPHLAFHIPVESSTPKQEIRHEYYPNEPIAAEPVRAALPKITIAMIICGFVSAGGIGAASAAPAGDDARTVSVHYDAQNLATDAAAHALYRQLVSAAEQVCPAAAGSPHLVSSQVRQCREESVARAVYKINNPKLVAYYSTSTKNG